MTSMPTCPIGRTQGHDGSSDGLRPGYRGEGHDRCSMLEVNRQQRQGLTTEASTISQRTRSMMYRARDVLSSLPMQQQNKCKKCPL
jgi:hypothetical protein